jgi:hypothetical protein
MSQTEHTTTSAAEDERQLRIAQPGRQQDIDSPRADDAVSKPVGETARPGLGSSNVSESDTAKVALLDNASEYERRWSDIQSGFVDEPRRSVEQADALVAEVIQSLTETFSGERQRLESQWSAGENVSTDDLRTSLQRYRSFFHRLLTR